MRLSEIGEFGLIERLEGVLPVPSAEVVVSIGDDAAVWRCNGKLAIATTDTLVEGVHFRRNSASWYELGWKSIAANLSDIAAMGGIARYALVTIGLPGDVEVEQVGELYRGIADICQKFGTFVVGGDTVASPFGVVVSVTVFGEALDEGVPLKLMLRSAAQVGDQVCVTGFLGSSAAGMEVLLRGVEVEPDLAIGLRQAHLHPLPRLAEGQRLVALGVRAGMDISDGLAGDLQKICRQSGVGARIWLDRLPIHGAVRTVFPDRAIDFALYGGEDYELLFCAPREIITAARSALEDQGLAPITVIGEILPDPVGEVILQMSNGAEIKARRGSYDHFGGPAGE